MVVCSCQLEGQGLGGWLATRIEQRCWRSWGRTDGHIGAMPRWRQPGSPSIRPRGVNVARGGKLRVLQAASWLGELRCAQTTLEKTPLCMNRPPLLPPTTLPKAQPFNGLHGFVHILATLPACVNSDLCAHTVIFEGPKLSIEPHMMALTNAKTNCILPHVVAKST